MPTVSHGTRVVVEVAFDCGCTMIYVFDLVDAEEAKSWAMPMTPAKMEGKYWVAEEMKPGEPDNICGHVSDRCDIADEKYAPAKELGVQLAIEYLANLERIA
jgi:hypothetical protein